MTKPNKNYPYIVNLALSLDNNSKIFKYIKKRKGLGVVVTAFVIALGVSIGIRVPAVLIDNSCGEGFASMGCGFLTNLIVMPLFLACTFIVAVYAFRALVVNKASLAIISVSVVGILVIAGIYQESKMLYSLTGGYDSANTAVNLIATAWLFVFSAIALAIHVYVFKALLKVHIILTILVAILMCIGYLYFIPNFLN